MLCSVSNLALLLAAAALCIQAVTNEADLTEMGEVVSMVGPTNLPENPTKVECTTLASSIPLICKFLDELSCATLNSKIIAKCGADEGFNMEDDGEAMGEDAEILSPSDDEDEEDSSHDIGASTSVGRRGGMLSLPVLSV